jgi:hypothetical protein
VFRPAVPEGFEWVVPVDDVDFEVFRSLDGTPRNTAWKPISVRVLRFDELGEPRRPADLPWLGGHVLVLTARAVDALGERLRQSGELLPLRCDDADLYVYNPLQVVDALDENCSDLVRFYGGRVMTIARHAFKAEALVGANVFKLPQMPRGSIYTTSELVDAVEAAGLRGTLFEKVWAADPSSKC